MKKAPQFRGNPTSQRTAERLDGALEPIRSQVAVLLVRAQAPAGQAWPGRAELAPEPAGPASSQVDGAGAGAEADGRSRGRQRIRRRRRRRGCRRRWWFRSPPLAGRTGCRSCCSWRSSSVGVRACSALSRVITTLVVKNTAARTMVTRTRALAAPRPEIRPPVPPPPMPSAPPSDRCSMHCEHQRDAGDQVNDKQDVLHEKLRPGTRMDRLKARRRGAAKPLSGISYGDG